MGSIHVGQPSSPVPSGGRPRRLALALLVPALAALAVIGGPAAPSAQGAYRAYRVAGLPTPIQHIVVMYDENLSFDHYLGDYCQHAVRRTPCNVDPRTGQPFDVTAPVTVSTPTRGNAAATTTMNPYAGPDLSPNILHDPTAQSEAMKDQWLKIWACQPAHGAACFGYLSRDEVSAGSALATLGTVSDATFETNGVPSWQAHAQLVDSGSLYGFNGKLPKYINNGQPKGVPGWGCDSNTDALWAPDPQTPLSYQPSCFPDTADPGIPGFGGAYRPSPVQANVPTLMQEMDQAGITYKFYAATSGMSNYKWTTCPTFASCRYTGENANVVPNSQFFTDAAAGTLPNVAFFLPGPNGPSDWSEHNGTSIAVGENKMADVYNAIFHGPAAASTVLENLKDDCGCFYDHVTAGGPVSAPATVAGQPPGPRVPALFNGAYVKPGYTDSTPADLNSTTALIEWLMGLGHLGAHTPDALAYDYSGVFDFTTPAPPRYPRLRHRTVSRSELHYIATHPSHDANDPT